MDDLYWCHEGCGFVKKDHRCEQWCCVYTIPWAAVAKLESKRNDIRSADFKRVRESLVDYYNIGIAGDHVIVLRSKKAIAALDRLEER